MLNEIDNKPQDMQQPVAEQNVPKEIGRTERPLNARTQTNNVYLDSVYAYASGTLPDNSSTAITWWTYNITWKYPFDKNSSWIEIPKAWTYMVIVTAIFEAYELGSRKSDIRVNGTPIQRFYTEPIALSAVASTHYITTIYNLVEWDVLSTNLLQDNEDGASLDYSVSIQAVKLS